MRLGEIQGRMAQALFRPLDKTWGMDRSPAGTPSAAKEAGLYIRPNRRLSAFERLEIYNRSYWYRLMDAFSEDFPGLRAILGRKRFTALAFAYLTDCPSRSFMLRNLGSRLPRWLSRHSELTKEAPRLALDMARLEWADVVAFDGEERPPIEISEVLAQATEARFGLQPHLTLLDAAYEVDDLRIAVNELGESQFAKARAMARRMARVRACQRCIAVYRRDFSVYYRRLEVPEYRLLRALGRGVPLGAAIESASRQPAELRPESVRAWFAVWARLGWLTAPAAR
jgi:hypothetical protein